MALSSPDISWKADSLCIRFLIFKKKTDLMSAFRPLHANKNAPRNTLVWFDDIYLFTQKDFSARNHRTRNLCLLLEPEKGVWEWQDAVVRNLGPRNPKKRLNSQFFHLLYSVMSQHEIEGTLEIGAFEENFLPRGYLQMLSAVEP